MTTNVIINVIAVVGMIVLLFATVIILYWKGCIRYRSRQRTPRITPEILQAVVIAIQEQRREETRKNYEDRKRETSLPKEHIVIINPGENVSMGLKCVTPTDTF